MALQGPRQEASVEIALRPLPRQRRHPNGGYRITSLRRRVTAGAWITQLRDDAGHP